MKLHILSDIHAEFEPFDPPQTEADIVILAGDIHLGKKGLDWAKNQFPDSPVLYVLGNHEHYGQALPKHVAKLQQLAAGSNVHILENSRLDIGEVTFLGCTLWTDFRLYGDPRIAGYEATQKMTDYKKIRVSPQYRKLRSIDTATIHLHSRSWLAKHVRQASNRKVVIVTHHAPSEESIPLWHRDDILSAAYASALDSFVASSGAALWVHGHVHVQQDYMIGSTRVVCNPKGYPDEAHAAFMPDYVLEI